MYELKLVPFKARLYQRYQGILITTMR
jgi:hypothetical protein